MLTSIPYRKRPLYLLVGLLCSTPSVAQPLIPDTITVPATRTERPSAQVPESIAIVDQTRLEQERMNNINDALRGTPGVLVESTSGAYSTRMTVRGAGLKANYGIREIMLLRDGVPITDPDSFTRMDFIDTQLSRLKSVRGRVTLRQWFSRRHPSDPVQIGICRPTRPTAPGVGQ